MIFNRSGKHLHGLHSGAAKSAAFPLLPLFIVAALVLLSSGIAPARAQTPWILTGSDFKTDSVLLTAIDASGLHVTRAGSSGDTLVAFDRFLQITRNLPSVEKGGKFTLRLLGGDQLVGEPVAIHGQTLTWDSPLLGQLPVSLRNVVAMTVLGKAPPAERTKQDVAVLSNGDSVRGIVTALADGKLTLQADGQSTDLPLASVSLINFASTGGTVSGATAFRIYLDDGSSLTVSHPMLTGDKFSVAFGKQEPRMIEVAHVTGIEQINGPVSWLSSRPPVENVYVPFFGTELLWPAQMDRTVDGVPIRFKEQTFTHGIGVHAYSRLSWPLDGSYAAFRTRFAIAGDGTLADVSVRVRLDDKVAFEQPHVRAGELSPVVQLQIQGATNLTLEVDFGSSGDAQDRLNWIEPALLRQAIAPETQPAAAPTSAPATGPS